MDNINSMEKKSLICSDTITYGTAKSIMVQHVQKFGVQRCKLSAKFKI